MNSVPVSIFACNYGLYFNPLNDKLNPICHFLSLLGAHHILHVSRIRVNSDFETLYDKTMYITSPDHNTILPKGLLKTDK